MPTNGISGGPGGRSLNSMPTTIKPKKKPAPPRPPQPKIKSSMSFNTASDLATPGAIRPGGVPGRDLIDFSTPPGSPSTGRRNTVANISTGVKDPNEFSYRVGASIFYVKSPLKNSTSETPVPNPFSPPRPSADCLNQHQKAVPLPANLNAAWNSPAKTAPTSTHSPWGDASASAPNRNTVAPPPQPNPGFAQFQNSSSPDNNNSIKSSHYQNHQPSWNQVGASSSSNASSDRNSAVLTDFGGGARYSNLDFKKELSATLSNSGGSSGPPQGTKKPTIIRPATKPTPPPAVETPSNSSFSSRDLMNSIKSQISTDTTEETDKPQRNYYDVPPDDDDDEDEYGTEDPNDSSLMASPPMPSEPPPPPPPDVLAVDEWVSLTTGVAEYPDAYSDAGQGQAYAFAIYDFEPETDTDLALKKGDLVYLIRKIDDSWYYGSCDDKQGMFPASFVNVQCPVPEPSEDDEVTVLYDFEAEAEGDLSLTVGEKVKVTGRINDEWLYGEKGQFRGQFPAAFVSEITKDLPLVSS